ncbi:GreA/GreB family elongation factor [Anaerohalosphaeraceae bacterium U12dextr]
MVKIKQQGLFERMRKTVQRATKTVFPTPVREYRMLSESDYFRLQAILSKGLKELGTTEARHARRIRQLLKHGFLFACKRIPYSVVTMNSQVQLRSLRGTRFVVTLVYPQDADRKQRKISVLSPLGMSLLGRAVGQSLSRNLVIEKMIYQPEIAGDFHL